MKLGLALRRSLFALSILIANTLAAFAHSLPDTTLTFSVSGRQLELSIRIPLEDLVLAAPELKSLERAPRDQSLPENSIDRLSLYFDDHLALQKASSKIPMELVEASIQKARNEHVGDFEILVIRLAAPPLLGGGDFFPLTLIYDAVMHEVRSHRVAVYWAQEDKPLTLLSTFGFHEFTENQHKILLTRP